MDPRRSVKAVWKLIMISAIDLMVMDTFATAVPASSSTVISPTS